MLVLVLLVIATVLVISFIVFLIKGKKYDAVVKVLTGNEYTLSEIYGVGFVWQDSMHALSYNSKLGQSIAKEINYLYGSEYQEFYTRVIIAKAITIIHFGAAVSFVLGPILFSDSTVFLIAVGGTIASVLIGYNTIREPGKKNQEISNELSIQIPNMVMKLALLLGTGMTLRDAWFYVAAHSEGKLGELMAESCEEIRNGKSVVSAIYNMGNCSTSKEVKRLTSMIVQGIERGNDRLGEILTRQADELWESKRQRMLQMGEEAAAKLLIPTMLTFVGLILVIIVSSLGGITM